MTQVLPTPTEAAARVRFRPVFPWRVTGGVLLLGVLAWRYGAGPFLDGLLATTPWALATALLVTAATTWCCAQRWRLVAAGHHEVIPLSLCYPAYYRSQVINATVPGGVLGDVHRGWRFGWRPVVEERVIGQVVQAGLAGALVLPGLWPWAAVVGLLVVATVAGGAVVLLSVLSSGGHLGVFLLAAATVGVDLPLTTLLPIGALVLLGSSIPLNVAGWGPREGVAAWAFASYGSTAALGLTASVTFGVLSTAATLPGAWAIWRLRGRHG